jgi:hypothetical protein
MASRARRRGQRLVRPLEETAAWAWAWARSGCPVPFAASPSAGRISASTPTSVREYLQC